jgi:hypothetical protein
MRTRNIMCKIEKRGGILKTGISQLQSSLLILFSVLTISNASKLSDLAAVLPAKSFVKITGNASLNALSLEYSIMYWTNSGVYDPIKKQVRWIGGPGSCCSNPPVFKMITYDEATDTWTVAETPYTGTGHGYDANTINPATGLHYFGQKDEPQVRVWNGASFALLPAAPFSSMTTPSLTWYPQVNSGAGGLLFMGDEGKLAWYNGTTWTAITGVQVTGYDNFSEYNRINKVVWLGSGSGSYRLSADLTLTKLAAAPFSLEGNACALHSCDPISGLFIVTNLANSSWWTFDIMADSWVQITGLVNKPDFGTGCGGNGNNQFQVVIPEYGVIMYVDHNTTPLSVYLYKHTNPTSMVRKTADQLSPGFAIKVRQNSLRANPVISWTGPANLVKVDIFNLDGRLIRSFSVNKNPMTLPINGREHMAVLLKVSTGNKAVCRKIFL